MDANKPENDLLKAVAEYAGQRSYALIRDEVFELRERSTPTLEQFRKWMWTLNDIQRCKNNNRNNNRQWIDAHPKRPDTSPEG